MGRQRGQLEEWRTRVDEMLETIAGEELAPLRVPSPRGLRAAPGGNSEVVVQLFEQLGVMLGVAAEGVGSGITSGREHRVSRQGPSSPRRR
jgi:hypothetical protein